VANLPVVYPDAVEIADVANVPAATVHYPSADGLPMSGASCIGVGFTAEDVTLALEVSIDRVVWHDITGICESITLAGLFGFGWIGEDYVVPAGAAVSDIIQAWMVHGASFVRLSATYPNGTNELNAWLRRGSL
jgi:hypothetical protein